MAALERLVVLAWKSHVTTRQDIFLPAEALRRFYGPKKDLLHEVGSICQDHRSGIWLTVEWSGVAAHSDDVARKWDSQLWSFTLYPWWFFFNHSSLIGWLTKLFSALCQIDKKMIFTCRNFKEIRYWQCDWKLSTLVFPFAGRDLSSMSWNLE